MRKIYILGICGTFMAGIASLAKEFGLDVSGCDEKVYPPMDQQLQRLGIPYREGYLPEHIPSDCDEIIVGNAIKRGNLAFEKVMTDRLRYISGPQWLYETVLRDRIVIAVSGTHGKTTTTSMLAWIFEVCGKNPGFLIGGVAENFGLSARLGSGPFFIIEADEYDTAFFDKRPKFLHYRPHGLIINNVEFDHADIYRDLASIQQQFHYLLRTVPREGCVVYPKEDHNIPWILEQGLWTPSHTLALNDPTAHWSSELIAPAGQHFRVLKHGKPVMEIQWEMIGLHNIKNALAAIAIADFYNLSHREIEKALNTFKSVKRRLEVKGIRNKITVYDDFAHHPTAIHTTLDGLRRKVGDAKIHAVVECRSYTMKMGYHENTLSDALLAADHIYLMKPDAIHWNINAVAERCNTPAQVFNDTKDIVNALKNQAQPGDHILIMSNGGFAGIYDMLLQALEAEETMMA